MQVTRWPDERRALPSASSSWKPMNPFLSMSNLLKTFEHMQAQPRRRSPLTPPLSALSGRQLGLVNVVELAQREAWVNCPCSCF